MTAFRREAPTQAGPGGAGGGEGEEFSAAETCAANEMLRDYMNKLRGCVRANQGFLQTMRVFGRKPDARAPPPTEMQTERLLHFVANSWGNDAREGEEHEVVRFRELVGRFLKTHLPAALSGKGKEDGAEDEEARGSGKNIVVVEGSWCGRLLPSSGTLGMVFFGCILPQIV